ncbi:cystathionine gamma-lyase [Oratosquilla oratoria]|uniref:cystathionine gamma-lyase n=1 Tax=Oratosquilla oratoria TaxID=337810 RepID=UPI003F75EA28
MVHGTDFKINDPSFSTKAIHVGNEPEQWKSLAVVPPISLATTFKQDSPGNHRGFEYGRAGNPTRDCLERCIAATEECKYAMCFASGLAATTTIAHLMSKGDHVISMDDVYGGTNRYFRHVASRMGIEVEFVDATDANNVAKAIKENTKMVWVETPTNPTLKLVDISAVAAVVKEHPNIFMVTDNTFMSSYMQRPSTLGSDLVFHSCTKYMNGHSDVIMGVVCTNNDTLHERLRFLQNAIGAVPSPMDCYLVNRSLKTLAVRMEKHMSNGLAVARFLEDHPCVERVIHPGLPSHPQHELAKRQCYGHSGMVTFFIKGNNLKVSQKFFEHIKIFTLAESLGGYESLAELPSIMTHASVAKEERERLGITDGLIRLSVGLEGEEDLLNDLDQALNKAMKETQ